MSGIDTQQWARTSPPSSVLLPSCTIYDLQPHIRQVWMLSIPRAVNRCGGTPTHSISKAYKSSLCSEETRNIFSFQSWGHKTRLQRRLRRRRSECLQQKQTRWLTYLIPSAPCNPPRMTLAAFMCCAFLSHQSPIQNFNRHPLSVIKRRRSGPAGLHRITSPLILN